MFVTYKVEMYPDDLSDDVVTCAAITKPAFTAMQWIQAANALYQIDPVGETPATVMQETVTNTFENYSCPIGQLQIADLDTGYVYCSKLSCCFISIWAYI